jgi:hypothetical protein
MKHIIRALKYFVKFSILCALIVTALVMIGAVEGDINTIFDEGIRSVIKILVFFAAISAIYPTVGFIKKRLDIDKDWSEVRPAIVEYMQERQYEIEKEDNDSITFRIKGFSGKFSKMFGDRITVTKGPEGYTMEGLRKDVLRIASGLEYKYTNKED